MTTGAQQAIGLVTALFGEAGQAVLVEEATYPGALDMARAAGMRPVGAALDEGGVVVDALEELLDRVRPRFAYLVPVHQNPTGSVLSDARSRAVAELSARYRVPVVEDLALRDLRMSDRPVPAPIAAHDPEALVISIGSMSKVFWAGLRVGWIRAPRPIVERLVQLKVRSDLSSDVLSQVIAAAVAAAAGRGRRGAARRPPRRARGPGGRARAAPAGLDVGHAHRRLHPVGAHPGRRRARVRPGGAALRRHRRAGAGAVGRRAATPTACACRSWPRRRCWRRRRAGWRSPGRPTGAAAPPRTRPAAIIV